MSLVSAVRYYEEALRRGHADAALCLGTLYYHGRGHVKKDLEKAFELYNVAVERGCVAAWPNLPHVAESCVPWPHSSRFPASCQPLLTAFVGSTSLVGAAST